MPRTGSTPPPRCEAARRRTPGTLASRGSAPPAVSVSVQPCSAGISPVNRVARLGVHMHVLQVASVKVSPVRRSSASAGIRASAQPGSSGQCRGARCWSVMRIRKLGRNSRVACYGGGKHATKELHMPLVPTVVRRDAHGERSFDIYSRLLDERVIFLGEAIDDQIANL